jgi:hypothetical protein
MSLFKSLGKSFLHYAWRLILLLIIMAPLLWVCAHHAGKVQEISTIISQNTPFLVVFRCTLLLAVFLLWPGLVRYCSAKYQWSMERTQLWQHQRTRAMIWLLLFELVVCDNLLLVLIHQVEGYLT